jgi:hypothetical protein
MFRGRGCFHSLRVRLGDAVFAGGIAWLSLLGNDLSLAGDAALQLRLNFSTTSLFEWIGATAREDC